VTRQGGTMTRNVRDVAKLQRQVKSGKCHEGKSDIE